MKRPKLLPVGGGVVAAAAFAFAALLLLMDPAAASAQHCNVLRRAPEGVPGQHPITLCTNVSSLPAGKK